MAAQKKQKPIFGVAAETVAVTRATEPTKKTPAKKAATKKAAPRTVFLQAHMRPGEVRGLDKLAREHGLTRADIVRALVRLVGADADLQANVLAELGRASPEK